MKRALYVGKFQPWHLGHESILEYIAAAPDVDEIIIGVGSAQWDWRNRNPDRSWLTNIFTFEERREIIENSLRGRVSKKVHVFPVMDFLPYWGDVSTLQWFEYIRSHCPEFHCLYTNRKPEVELFSMAGYGVRSHPLNYGFSATLVREKMARGEIWEPFVLPEAEAVIRRVGGGKRAAELYAKTGVRPEDYEYYAWEWRTFDRPTAKDIKSILALPFYRDEDVSDTYIVSLANTSVNFKIRRGGLKAKKLLTVRDGIEAWASFEYDLPLDRDLLMAGCDEIRFPLFHLLPDLGGGRLDIGERDLLTLPRGYNPYAFLLTLGKKRFMRRFQAEGVSCGVDISVFSLGGRNIISVGLEAKNKAHVAMAIEKLGLEKYRPMNYLQFLEGFIDKETAGDVWQKL